MAKYVKGAMTSAWLRSGAKVTKVPAAPVRGPVEKAAQKLFGMTRSALFNRNPTAREYTLAGGAIDPGRAGKFDPARSLARHTSIAKARDASRRISAKLPAQSPMSQLIEKAKSARQASQVRQVAVGQRLREIQASGGSGHHSEDQPRDDQGRWA